MIAARSESSPSVGDTVWTDCVLQLHRQRAAAAAPGRGPCASPSLKLPVICTSPVNDGWLTVGCRHDHAVELDRQLAGRAGLVAG